MSDKMTIPAVKDAAAALGVRAIWNAKLQEWKVGNAPQEYFTSDHDDAFETIKAMSSSAGKHAQATATNLAKLPEFCYAYHPTTQEPIIIKRGEDGYYPPKSPDVWVEEINGILGVTEEQEEAMLAGSLFGWGAPCANPDNYVGKKFQKEKLKSC